jgi:hypothetical protein
MPRLALKESYPPAIVVIALFAIFSFAFIFALGFFAGATWK